MIANFFNTTKPFNTLIIVILLILLYSISSVNSIDSNIDIIEFSKTVMLFLVLIVTFFMVNFIVRKNGLSKDNSYVLLIMVLCFGLFPQSSLNYLFIISNLILLFAFRRIYSLRTNKEIKEKIFDSAFWVGIATLIYPWSFLYILLIYAGVITFNKSTIKNIIIPLIGFFTPIFIYGAFLFAIDELNYINFSLNYNYSYVNYNSIQLLLPITLILGFLLWSIIPTTIKISTVNNEFKTSWSLVLFHLLISLMIGLTAVDKNGSELIFMFFPIAIIFTNYLQMVKEKWFKDVFLYSFLAVTITIYFL